MKALLRIAPLALFIALASQVAAQDYPSKPVHVYVPSSPGGASDIAARLVSPKLAEVLGQPFVVENRVASGGIVGTAQLAKAPPDGYAIMMTFDTFASNPHLYKELPYDVVKDFAPVMLLTRYPRSEEHTSELQSPYDLVCRLLLEKKAGLLLITQILLVIILLLNY